MLEQFFARFDALTDDNKSTIKNFAIGSIVLYVALQILGFLVPIFITLGISFLLFRDVKRKSSKSL